MTDTWLAMRFWAKVDQRGKDECWPWTACRLPRGYGRFGVDRRVELAHRVAMFLQTGAWPSLWVLHRCDNPPCVNPEHLFLGTASDNSIDMHAKGRWRADHRGEHNGAAKLSAAQVRRIRAERPRTTIRALTMKYRVTTSTVEKIIRRATWKHL